MNEVLPDTSVWVLFFRKSGSPEVKAALAQALREMRVYLSPVVAAELLRGARSQQEFQELKQDLLALPEAPNGSAVWIRAGELGQILKKNGLTVPLPDLAIAASAELGGLELWHADRHFEAIAEVANLKLRAFYL